MTIGTIPANNGPKIKTIKFLLNLIFFHRVFLSISKIFIIQLFYLVSQFLKLKK